MSFFRAYGLYFAWIVAIVATGGSLYFSEIMGFVPCDLCWYQRIFMYPLVILLGLASYRNDRNLIAYVMPLSIIGGLISLYHYGKQKIPALDAVMPCKSGIPCNQDHLDWLGFITIPFLALIAFILITFFLWASKAERSEESGPEEA